MSQFDWRAIAHRQVVRVVALVTKGRHRSRPSRVDVGVQLPRSRSDGRIIGLRDDSGLQTGLQLGIHLIPVASPPPAVTWNNVR
jgi:hypothetical protein